MKAKATCLGCSFYTNKINGKVSIFGTFLCSNQYCGKNIVDPAARAVVCSTVVAQEEENGFINKFEPSARTSEMRFLLSRILEFNLFIDITLAMNVIRK